MAPKKSKHRVVTIRLPAEEYWALRDFVAEKQRKRILGSMTDWVRDWIRQGVRS